MTFGGMSLQGLKVVKVLVANETQEQLLLGVTGDVLLELVLAQGEVSADSTARELGGRYSWGEGGRVFVARVGG